MGIANLHTTIDYKKLIETQANMVVERNHVAVGKEKINQRPMTKVKTSTRKR